MNLADSLEILENKRERHIGGGLVTQESSTFASAIGQSESLILRFAPIAPSLGASRRGDVIRDA